MRQTEEAGMRVSCMREKAIMVEILRKRHNKNAFTLQTQALKYITRNLTHEVQTQSLSVSYIGHTCLDDISMLRMGDGF